MSKRAVSTWKESGRLNFSMGMKDSNANSINVMTAIQGRGRTACMQVTAHNAQTTMVIRFWMLLRWWISPQVCSKNVRVHLRAMEGGDVRGCCVRDAITDWSMQRAGKIQENINSFMRRVL